MGHWFQAVVAAAALSVIGITGPAQAKGVPSRTYQSSWSQGLTGWSHSGAGWSVSRGVVSYDGNSASVLIAPYRVASRHYLVTAKLRLMAWRETGISESHGMGVLIRAKGAVDPAAQTAGLMAGLGEGFIGCDGVHSNAVVATADTDFNTVLQDKRPFDAGHTWHTIQVDVNGNAVKLTVDGRVRTSGSISRFAGASSVGLFSLSARIQVATFSIKQF